MAANPDLEHEALELSCQNLMNPQSFSVKIKKNKALNIIPKSVLSDLTKNTNILISKK